MTNGSEKSGAGGGFVVLELCSYGDSGDFQVLPRKVIEVRLEDSVKWLTGLGGRAAVIDGVLLAEMGGAQISLYADGRAVLERVSPCSRQAALELYHNLMQTETDSGTAPMSPGKTGD
jgi:hypothetical protein